MEIVWSKATLSWKNFGSILVSRKLPTYPSSKLTLTLSSRLGQNDGLGEGKVVSFPET